MPWAPNEQRKPGQDGTVATVFDSTVRIGSQIEALTAIKHGAADYFNLGGDNFDTTYRCAAIADAAQRRVWLQEEKDLSVGVPAAYAVHVASVIPNAVIPLDIRHFLRENDLIHNALPPKDGFIQVPDGPGLGAELDEDAVAHYRVG